VKVWTPKNVFPSWTFAGTTAPRLSVVEFLSLTSTVSSVKNDLTARVAISRSLSQNAEMTKTLLPNVKPPSRRYSMVSSSAAQNPE